MVAPMSHPISTFSSLMGARHKRRECLEKSLPDPRKLGCAHKGLALGRLSEEPLCDCMNAACDL